MSIEPLPKELREMISAEPKTALSPDVESRLLSRLDASIATAFAAPPVPAPKAPPLGGLKGAMLFLAGGLTGALITAAVINREPPVALAPPSAVPVPVAAPLVAPTVAPVESPPVDAPREDKPAIAVTVAAVKKPIPNTADAGAALTGTSALEQERRLLEPARTALARGLTPQALELLEKHEQQFANGVLAEERDALWVQALSVAGQPEAARARARRFRAAYPDSLFMPVVERALMSDAGN